MTGWIIIICALLIFTAAGDIRDRTISRKVILLLAGLGCVRPDRTMPDLAASAFFSCAVFAVLLVIFAVTEGRALGGGDVRLLSAEVLVLKEKELVIALVISACLLFLYRLYICGTKRHEGRRIPAAAFLCPGMIAALSVTAFMTLRLKM